MKLPRRHFLHLAAGVAALPAVPSAPALGQSTLRAITLFVGRELTASYWPSSLLRARVPLTASACTRRTATPSGRPQAAARRKASAPR